MATPLTAVPVLDLSPVSRSPSPTQSPASSVPVSSEPLSFSISKILGLEDDKTLRHNSTSSVPIEPPTRFAKSPSLCSDITSSSSDCDSEPDQEPSNSDQEPKKRQRTTFSAREVWEMERAFRRQPYLLRQDKDDLVRRLGIPENSVKFWFRNRRARSKRAEREKIAAYSTIPTNRFEWPGAERLPAQSPMYSTADQLLWFRARSDCSPTITDREDQPRLQLIKRENGYPQIKPNQFRAKHSFTPLPMYHPDRFKIRHAEPARLPTSRVSPRYQPYWVP